MSCFNALKMVKNLGRMYQKLRNDRKNLAHTIDFKFRVLWLLAWTNPVHQFFGLTMTDIGKKCRVCALLVPAHWAHLVKKSNKLSADLIWSLSSIHIIEFLISGILDTYYKPKMTDAEAIELGKRAIMHASFRDIGSGGYCSGETFVHFMAW